MSAREHTYNTTLTLCVGEAEAEYAATVTYMRHRAFDGGRESPSEPAYCEVIGVTLDYTPNRRFPLDELIYAELQDDLQPELMAEWADDDAAAQEARADARRDDAMMERWS